MLTFESQRPLRQDSGAARRVSPHINRQWGKSLPLIGANGAGKTTPLGTLCGDPRASSGRVVLDL